MAQFDVYRNPNGRTRKVTPYLLDIQVDLLRDTARRVVVPLLRKGEIIPICEMNPVFIVEAETVVMSTLEIASVPRGILGDPITSLRSERSAVIAAMDWLMTGI